MRALGIGMIACGMGLIVFEVVAHDARDALVIYVGVGQQVVGLALIGFADDIAAQIRPLVELAGRLLPWTRKGE